MKALFSIVILSTFLSSALSPQKTIQALRTDSDMTIDGVLDERAWLDYQGKATDFVSVSPRPNEIPSYQTEVSVIYNDEAIYIAGFMMDAADSIMQQLSLRDNFGPNNDFFGVIIDAYGNGNSAVEFMVSSTGVQLDNKLSPNNGDVSWDAVWYSESQVADNGWYIEMKIPFAALRFPKKDVQTWKVNFFRRRTVDGSFHTWNNVDFEQNNAWLTHMGTLEGIRDIKPPLRLSITPYASTYGVKATDPANGSSSTGLSYIYGMDVKWGVNDAYTLDMTLVPDFGQARSDDQVLNLSPFEVRFSENRAFFTEGLEMFNKAGIFYSRRIGQNQQLYNATKLTGRNEKGLAIGLFNAVGKKESSTYYDEASESMITNIDAPLTNYNIVVIDQDLKNNSSISLTNTNVMRQGTMFHNANVTSATFNLKNKSQSYGISGRTAISQIIHKDSDNKVGHDLNVSFDKLNGSSVFGIGYTETSQNYDHNDLGFFTQSNFRRLGLYFNKRDFDGFGTFNQFNYWVNLNYTRNIIPDSYSDLRFNAGFYAQTKSFLQFNLWGNATPSHNDFFEPRSPGRHFYRAANYGGGFWIGTDYRKKFQAQAYGNLFNNDQSIGWVNSSISSSLRYRFSNKVTAYMDLTFSKENNAQGFVAQTDDSIVFGTRDVNSTTNSINLEYTVNNKMGFDIRMRHFWSKVHYQDFHNLEIDGSLGQTDYSEFRDFSFNAFTIDANYRWRFAPGSELIVVWKNNISGVLADPTVNYEQVNYRDGISGLGALPQTNSLSIRFSYFLDYSTHIKPLLN